MDKSTNELQAWLFLPKYGNPFERDYLGHNEYIRTFNRSLQQTVSKIINHFMDNQPVITFTTTGSDGRFEKGPQSKLEVLILKDGNHAIVESIDDVKEKITRYPFNEIFGNIEVKDLGEAGVVSYYKENPRSVYPTRIFDIQYLSGNIALIQKAYNKIFYELTGYLSSKIFDYLRNNRRRARQIMENGAQIFKDNKITHFDLERGISFYDQQGIEGNTGSFKYGPLRFVQYKFAEDLAVHIKNRSDTHILGDLPTNIVERFLTIQAEGMTTLSPLETMDVVDSYKYFLWLYHLSQFNFKNGKRETEFDKPEVRERINSLKGIFVNRRIFN